MAKYLKLAAKGTLSPNPNLKEIVLVTDERCTTGMTYDAGADFTRVLGVLISDMSGAQRTATLQGNLIKIGEVTTGVHCLRVWGL